MAMLAGVDPLPLDPLMPQIVEAVRKERRLVLEAPPGAGKTTRVPPALLGDDVARGGDVVVLEPRRLAARLAAGRVAAERGERLGETVGCQVRFERVGGARTRLWFVTEGILARRLLSDPMLDGTSVVVLDEFHERHLASDVALASLKRLQAGARPDLAIVVMSATLDAAPVAAYLGDCPRIRSEGRAHPVEVEYLPRKSAARLSQQVAGAVAKVAAGSPRGDVLVFLPSTAEIREAEAACAPIAKAAGMDVRPLHASLLLADQERAVRRSERPKVVLATNVAETSITIDGVVAVVDTGLAKVAGHAAWSGLPTLETRPVSRASAAQRAGRAGRTGPGRCLRLYTRADHDARPAFDAPEVARLDLAETVLELRASDEDAAAFPWFEAPPPAALAAADALLARLGALDAAHRVTPVGRRMLAFPLHPRLARLLVKAQDLGAEALGAEVAALLSERDVFFFDARSGGARPDPHAADSDLEARLDAMERLRASDFDPRTARSLGVDLGAARAVDRVRLDLLRSLGDRRPRGAGHDDVPRALAACALAAFPDRVARRPRLDQPGLALCGGGSAALSPRCAVRDAALLVAIDAEEGDRGLPLVRSAVRVEPEDLVEAHPDAVLEEVAARWIADGERVEAVRRTVYERLVLEQTRVAADRAPEVERVLAAEAARAGPKAFADPEALDRLLARTAFAAGVAPKAASLRALTEEDAREALLALCAGRSSFKELREAGLLEALAASLAPAARAALDALAPERVPVGAGRTARVGYAAGRPPWVEAPIQDFFGCARGPAVAGGRVPVTLHLLAPSRRPVQTTADLAGFWDRHWPAVRRELSRRYPKHAWPEDPRRASPPPPKKRTR